MQFDKSASIWYFETKLPKVAILSYNHARSVQLSLSPIAAQPTDLSNLIERVIPDLPPSLTAVALYALEHGNNLALQSVDDIAAACKVSKASVVRFCHALGYDGWRTLKQSLITDRLSSGSRANVGSGKTGNTCTVREANPSYGAFTNLPISAECDTEIQLQAVLHAVAESVLTGGRLTGKRVFADAAQSIARASLVVWYGVGDSSYLASSGYHRCQINRMNSKASHIPEDIQTLARQFTNNDVLVCVSRAGRISSIVNPVRIVRNSSPATIVAITGDPGSPLAQLAHYTLVSAPIDLYVQEQRTTLQTAQMSMIDALITAVLQMRHGRLRPIGAGNNGVAFGDKESG